MRRVVVGMLFVLSVCSSVLAGTNIVRIPRQSFTPAPWYPEFSGCLSLQENKFVVVSDERDIDKDDPYFLTSGTTNRARDVLWEIDFRYGTVLRTLDTDYQGNEEMSGMEALSSDGSGGLYIMTAQSLSKNKPDGDHWANREKLQRLDSKFKEKGVINDLRNEMIDGDLKDVNNFDYTAMYPVLDTPLYHTSFPEEGGINVEGVAYNRDAKVLMFGFRSPLVDASDPSVPGTFAMITMISNLNDTTWNYWASDEDNYYTRLKWRGPKLLNLGGLGVRDMYYAGNNQLFILAGKTTDSIYTDDTGSVVTNADSYLIGVNTTTWKTNYLDRIPGIMDSGATLVINGVETVIEPALAHAEGITKITANNTNFLLITFDSKVEGIYRNDYLFPVVPANLDTSKLANCPDVDEDGMTDLEEIYYGTSVTNPFLITAFERSADNTSIAVKWFGHQGCSYKVQTMSDLRTDTAWTTVATVTGAFTCEWSYSLANNPAVAGAVVVRLLLNDKFASANAVSYQAVPALGNDAFNLVGCNVDQVGGTAHTLSTFFGSQLIVGSDSNSADKVYLYDTAVQGWRVYFKKLDGLIYEIGNVNSPNDPAITAGTGFYLRKAPGAQVMSTNVLLIGEVVGAEQVDMGMVQGFQMIAYPFTCSTLVDSTRLSENARAGLSMGSSDQLSRWAQDRYVYDTYGLKSPDRLWRQTSGWFGAGVNVPLQQGVGYGYRAVVGFTWTEDNPYFEKLSNP